jgi:hypothetical protein
LTEKVVSKSPIILITGLPGLAFWVNLILWSNDTRSGENYEFMIAAFLILCLSVVFMIACLIASVISSIRNDKIFWVIAALVNATPLILIALILSPRLFSAE